jgi:hypothetical protein
MHTERMKARQPGQSPVERTDRRAQGDEVFADTDFGVTPVEAAVSQYAAYNPDGWLKSLGVELNARYDFQNGWGLHGTLGLRRLRGDAARSPVTEEGSEDQFAPVSSSRAPSRSAGEDPGDGQFPANAQPAPT